MIKVAIALIVASAFGQSAEVREAKWQRLQPAINFFTSMPEVPSLGASALSRALLGDSLCRATTRRCPQRARPAGASRL